MKPENPTKEHSSHVRANGKSTEVPKRSCATRKKKNGCNERRSLPAPWINETELNELAIREIKHQCDARIKRIGAHAQGGRQHQTFPNNLGLKTISGIKERCTQQERKRRGKG
jgi:hypothetical protein